MTDKPGISYHQSTQVLHCLILNASRAALSKMALVEVVLIQVLPQTVVLIHRHQARYSIIKSPP